MAEQPIKIGDLIEIEGTFAMVEEIGARCTRIRTGANIHMDDFISEVGECSEILAVVRSGAMAIAHGKNVLSTEI